jgi:hypothetical protein
MIEDLYVWNDEDILDVNHAEKESKVVRLKGGKGSGHFNHAGIPGHQGGSLSSGTIALSDDAVKKIFNVAKRDSGGAEIGTGGIDSEVWTYDPAGVHYTQAWKDLEKQTGVNQATIKAAISPTTFGPFDDTYAGTHVVARAEQVFGLKRSEYDLQSEIETKEKSAWATKKDIRNDMIANGFTRFARVVSDEDMDKILEASYDNTQNLLREIGIKEIKVYRGITEKSSSGSANLFESWTAERSIAEKFAGKGGIVQEQTVPAARVFGVPIKGWGVNVQLEVIVLNGVPKR